MKSLYEIDNDLRVMMENAEKEAIENEGEISFVLAAQLETLQQEREVKIGNICRYYKSLIAEAEMVSEESKVLADRAKTTANKAEALKKYLAQFMKTGEPFADVNSKVSWRKSEAVDVDPFAVVPEEFKKIKVEPDIAAIKKVLKSGAEVVGFNLIEKQNIQIK